MERRSGPRQTLEEGLPPEAQLLVGEIATQARARRAPNVERPTATMWQALLRRDSPSIKGLFVYAAESTIKGKNIGAAAAVSGLRTALVDYFTARYEEAGKEFSDADRLTADDWAEPVDTLEEDLRTGASTAFDSSLIGGIAFRTAATPVTSRYYPVELISQLVSERFPQGIRAIDIGSSIMAGALQLMYKDEFPMAFDEVRVWGENSKQGKDITGKTDEILSRNSIFKQIICIDNSLVYHEDRQTYDRPNRQHSISGLRPSERSSGYSDTVMALTNKKQRGTPEYDKASKSKVIFHAANLLKPKELAEFKDKFPEPVELAIINYLTQELSRHDQIKLHQIARSVVSEDGLIVYIHQARIKRRLTNIPTDIRNVKPYESYALVPYRSNMHVEDNLNPVRGLQEMMNFYDNRCRAARLRTGKFVGKLMVNGSLEPVADLIKNG